MSLPRLGLLCAFQALIMFQPSPFAVNAFPADVNERLDAFDVLLYRDADGVIRPVQSAQDWELRRQEIVRGMQTVMGPLPTRSPLPLDIQVLEEVDMSRYRRQLITFQTDSETRTPAYLCIPKHSSEAEKRFPAVLCLHPTDNLVGHQVVVGLAGKPGRQYAAELAERGYVTLAPAYPHLANYWPNLGRLGYSSGTMKAIWDNQRAIDLLSSLAYVDMSRGVGAIGHSLGGHNAIYTAVLEPRISVIVSSCGFDSYRDYYDGNVRNWYFGRGWCQIRYMPKMSDYRERLAEIPFDFPELLAALSPRPIFINAPQRDSNFRWQSVDRCVESARKVYDLFGAADRVSVVHPDCDHNFPEEIRQQAYQVMDSVLLPRPNP